MYVTQDFQAVMSKAHYWDGLNSNNFVFPVKCFGLGYRGNLTCKFRPLGEGHAAMTQTNLLEFS